FPLLLSAHRPTPGTCASRSVSGACAIERCSPSSVPFPPRPPREVSLLCSAGSQVLRHSPTSPARACPPCGFGLRGPALIIRPRRAGDLPVLVYVVSQRARVLRLRRTDRPLAIYVAAVLPSPYSE